MLLLNFSDPISDCLLIEAEGTMAHRNTSFLLSVIDFDPHVRLRALKHLENVFTAKHSQHSTYPLRRVGSVVDWPRNSC